MHVSARKMSFLGLMMAFSVILVVMGSIIEMSTLFFLALASFVTGIVIVEYKTALGAAFYVGSVLLSLILSPNKLYALTYAGMACYLLLKEIVWSNIMKHKATKTNLIVLTLVKFLIFNVMYIPILVFLPSLVITKEMNVYLMCGFIVGGQVILLLYDRAFDQFMGRYWLDMKRRLKI